MLATKFRTCLALEQKSSVALALYSLVLYVSGLIVDPWASAGGGQMILTSQTFLGKFQILSNSTPCDLDVPKDLSKESYRYAQMV